MFRNKLVGWISSLTPEKARRMRQRDEQRRARVERLGLERLEDRIVLAASTFSFAQANFDVLEGDATTTTSAVVVNRSDSSGAESVDVTVSDGSATAGSDYTAPALNTITVNFTNGNSTATADIEILGDTTTLEGDETINLDILDDGNGGSDSATLTLLNDDATVSIGNVSLEEGSDGGTTSFSFTVTLSETVAQDIDASILTASTSDGAAVAGSDFTALSGSGVSITAGSTSGTVTVNIDADTTAENDEDFSVTLTDVDGTDGITISSGTGTGMIFNDDLTLLIDDVSVVEGSTVGNYTTHTFTISSSGGFTIGDSLEIFLTQTDGTASGGTDDTFDFRTDLSDSMVTLAGNQTSVTFDVLVVQDQTPESDENFTVGISSVQIVEVGEPQGVTFSDTGTGTILNDDTEITISDLSMAEGTDPDGSAPFTTTSFTFTITLSHAVAQDIDGSLITADTSNGTATGMDFSGLNNEAVLVTGGLTSGTVTVLVDADVSLESDENF
ncbi:MAG: hypothetical protein N2C14_01240, partial [Planctomycetales bacterium]